VKLGLIDNNELGKFKVEKIIEPNNLYLYGLKAYRYKIDDKEIVKIKGIKKPIENEITNNLDDYKTLIYNSDLSRILKKYNIKIKDNLSALKELIKKNPNIKIFKQTKFLRLYETMKRKNNINKQYITEIIKICDFENKKEIILNKLNQKEVNKSDKQRNNLLLNYIRL